MIVVDVEATGLDPHRHSLVSVGAVDFYRPESRFYRECRIWDGAEIDMSGLAVNGFTPEQVQDPAKDSVAELVREFTAWALGCSQRTIAGQNPSFDRDMLQISAQRAGLPWPLHHRTVDLHSVCYSHMLQRGIPPPQENGVSALNADAIYRYVGMPTEPKPHNALTGAVMETEAFARLLLGRSILAEFSRTPLPDYLISPSAR